MDNSSANYHGLNAKLEQRFSKGLSYLAAFSWGHSIGNHVTESGSDLWLRLQRYDNLRLSAAMSNMTSEDDSSSARSTNFLSGKLFQELPNRW